MKNILFSIGFLLSTFIANAVVVEKKVEVSEIDVDTFNQQLEERLRQDVKSFLGHERFIFQVKASLEKIQQWDVIDKVEYVEEPIEIENEKDSVESKQPEESETEQVISKETTVEDEDSGLEKEENLNRIQQLDLDIDNEFEKKPSFPVFENLPGMPFQQSPITTRELQAEKEALLKRSVSRNVIKTTIIKEKSLSNSVPNKKKNTLKKRVVNKSQTLLSEKVKINKLKIKLVLDKSTTSEQEAFIKALVIEKSNFLAIRGDDLIIIKTVFPNEDKNLQAEKEFDLETFLQTNWLYLLLSTLILFFILWLLFRSTKPSNSLPEPLERLDDEPDSDLIALFKKLDVKRDVEKEVTNDAYKEELVSLAVTQSENFKLLLKKWALSESKEEIKKAGLVYFLFGSSLFDKLFGKDISLKNQLLLSEESNDFEEMTPVDLNEYSSSIFQSFVKNNIVNGNENEKSQPFSFLNKLNNEQIKYLLDSQDTKVKSIVLSQIDSSRAALIIKDIPKESRSKIVLAISEFKDLPIATFTDIANKLAKSAVTVPSFNNIAVDGVDLLIDMLDNMDMGTETSLLDEIQNTNPDIYYKIKKLYISFSDLTKLSNIALKNIISEANRDQLALALSDMDDDFIEKILSVMIERPRALLKRAIKSTNNANAEDIQNAKQNVSRLARNLAKAGVINIEDIDDA